MKKIAFVFIIALLAACGEVTSKEEKVSIVYNDTRESANSDVFNSQFNLFLHRYYDLKNAFIKEQITVIDAAADSLSISIKSIPINELKADSTKKAAQILIESIQAELIGLKERLILKKSAKHFKWWASNYWYSFKKFNTIKKSFITNIAQWLWTTMGQAG